MVLTFPSKVVLGIGNGLQSCEIIHYVFFFLGDECVAGH